MPAQPILCPNLVELSALFAEDADDRQPKTALKMLREMKLLTTEDLCAKYPKIFDTPADTNEFKRLSAAMRTAGAGMEPRIDWRVEEDTEPGATQAPQLRRVLMRAGQQQRASLTFDKATAQRQADKIAAREDQANASKQAERDAQQSLQLHQELIAMVNYKVAPSDQAPPKLVVRVFNALTNGTLSATDLSIKKYVLRSQTMDKPMLS